MKKKALKKDIRKSFAHSKGRFISIMCLIALGSFALVGLQVAGPDMRLTGEEYFKKYNAADLSVIGSMGIDKENAAEIKKLSGVKKLEFGYLKDVVIEGTSKSVRVFSQSEDISQYEVTEGRLPESADEIALSDANRFGCKLGDEISFEEKSDAAGAAALKNTTFKITGFINSPEIISAVNEGQSTAGSGELNGYAAVTDEAFDCDYYMIARMTFDDTAGLDPYSEEYRDKVQEHKTELEDLLEDLPNARLESVKAEYQQEIDDGRSEIADAKAELADAKSQLEDAEKQIKEAEDEIADKRAELDKKVKQAQKEIKANEKKLAAAEEEIADGKEQLAEAQKQLTAAQQQITASEQKLTAAKAEYSKNMAEYKKQKAAYDKSMSEYKENAAALKSAQAEVNANRKKLEDGKAQYEEGIAQLGAGISQIEQALTDPNLTDEERAQYEAQLAGLKTQLEQTQAAYEQFTTETYEPGMKQAEAAQAEIDKKNAELKKAKAQLDEANAQLTSAKSQLAAAKTQIADGEKQLASAKSQLATKQKEFDSKTAELKSGESELADGKAALTEAKAELKKQKASGEKKLDKAQATLDEKKQEYEDGMSEYREKKEEADTEIADNEQKLDEAQENIDSLSAPTFSAYTRREIPGGEGYRTYDSVSEIVDALADVFPIFMYFVAALVTLTTMTRFVDEERINSGTLKALGYKERDIIKKFALYGLWSGLLGAVIGITAGTLLLPRIAYNAYKNGFTVPKILTPFDLKWTVIAVLLALASTVLPTVIVAKKELREKPSALLQPKPPANGSKILLERITPIWNKMSFTHKVTARNIFRYKKRMFMTIFGVCGSVTILFAGLSVQHSISGINDRQFGDIIKYDIIAAEKEHISADEQAELDEKLADKDAVESSSPICYKELNVTAGKSKDSQTIKLISPENADDFSDYIALDERKSGKAIDLTDDGAVISERLSTLLDVGAGDEAVFKNTDGSEVTLKISAVTEMYTGHFAFVSRDYYEQAVGEYNANAYLIRLNDRSSDNANAFANELMKLDGVEGVVQNTTMISQINIIVKSLNKIMGVLILVAAALGVVILYNLTNINVSERIRELSTIKVLGFFNKEVTLYIYRETIVLTALGILVGFLTGDWLYKYIITVVPPDEVMFNPALSARAFVIPAVLIAAITAILGVIINRRLKNVDMLDALKSVD